MFRRGYQLYATGSASGDEFLTRCLQGSAQCFAGDINCMLKGVLAETSF